MSARPLNYDVVIVGAGIVGSALAAALAKSTFNIAIVEAQESAIGGLALSAGVDTYDSRVSALTRASQAFLESIGAWQAVVDQRLSPYRHMHVWDAEGTGSIDFDAGDINQQALGHIVENRVTAGALAQCLDNRAADGHSLDYRGLDDRGLDYRGLDHNGVGDHGLDSHRSNSRANIHRISPATLEAIESVAGGGYLLTLADGRRIQTSLLVAADGANSNIRALAKMAVREWDYDHHAIVATVQTEYCHEHTAWQCFLPEGPLAFLPLSSDQEGKHYCSIVWSTLPHCAETLMTQTDEAFSAALAAAFEHRLGNILAVSRRSSFPLRQRHAIDYIKPGLVLVGDAAHTIHPLAGQGVNLGLMDVKVLSEELLRAQQRGLTPGSLAVLERYQRRRKGTNLTMMAAMEGLKRLFSETALPLRWARNSGLRWLDKSALLKRQMIKRAMGLS